MEDDVQLYLKYFHTPKAGKDHLDKTLEQIERENQHQQQQQQHPDNDHIDHLHPDLKTEGGTDTIISIGFMKKKKNANYKLASKKKKNQSKQQQLYDIFVRVRQDKYSNTGNAWKVWDSSLVLARYLYSNPELVQDKSVHELGSGCGLVGIVAALFAKHITLSDYKQEILENLERNVALNAQLFQETSSPSPLPLPSSSALTVKRLDFEEIAAESCVVKEADKVEVLLGADIIYGVHLANWLPHVVDKLLVAEGVFYLANPKNRFGVREFMEKMESSGFVCTTRAFPEEYWNDFVKKNCWDLIICRRNNSNSDNNNTDKNTEKNDIIPTNGSSNKLFYMRNANKRNDEEGSSSSNDEGEEEEDIIKNLYKQQKSTM